MAETDRLFGTCILYHIPYQQVNPHCRHTQAVRNLSLPSWATAVIYHLPSPQTSKGGRSHNRATFVNIWLKKPHPFPKDLVISLNQRRFVNNFTSIWHFENFNLCMHHLSSSNDWFAQLKTLSWCKNYGLDLCTCVNNYLL